MPKQQPYVEPNKYYLNRHYTQLLHTLQKYKPHQIPLSLQYQLPISYLQTNQANLFLHHHKKQITHTYTFHTHPQYFLFSIHIPQPNTNQALHIPTVLPDHPYI
ncbi:type VII secretion protein EssB/YukC, partial [Bacillus altitudinis]|uniref:type VII secretion protein EssB/YukC n=1 Tax=Bacillus altitudinis TaxID=293387 RepID=UPI002354734F